ncbi:MAG: hypothetical protein H8D23_23590 [Candidatus Brocadiales bacterium]|nr:hypothetical protein [Candidatus Brocadiales bacterium]
MLNAQEKHQMRCDVQNVIISFGKTMTVFRSEVVNAGSFAGSHKSDEITIGEYAVEQKLLSPKSLTEVGADLVIVCGSETGISEGDRVEIENKSYIISHINPQNAFGAVTHLEVNLEKDDSYQ